MVGQMFLINDTLLNVNKVTLTDDIRSIICWKVQLPKQDIGKEEFFN